MSGLGGGGGSPLLGLGDMEMEGMLDYKGLKAIRSKTGGWRSAGFLIGLEIAERIAFYGISSNIMTYLTGPLHQSTVFAAVSINTWSGAVCMFPLLGAFVADSYLSRYRTILLSSLLYVAGLGLLTLSTLLPPTQYQVILFFISLYIVAIAQGGHLPCALAFGADQFDGQHPIELKSRSSFFNWWFFGPSFGTIVCYTVLVYIQDNVSWALGFGLPSLSMGISLFVFLLGKKTYRYGVKDDHNPLMQIVLVFIVAAKNWRCTLPSSDIEEEAIGKYHQFKFLDRALFDNQNDLTESRIVCTVDQVNNAKSILRLIPIWCTCLTYAVVFCQVLTFFVKQGSTMDRSLGSSLQVPPASLQTCTSLSIVFFIPIYDRITRVFTNNPSGITTLQRVGFGMIISIINMVVAALVEKKRLKTALDFGLIDNPSAMVPMSIWWLLPQYFLMGVADAFTLVGLQEFFYDQIPNGLKSIGIGLCCSIIGIGSFLISVIEKVGGNDGDGWFSDNLNQGHLDSFYWFLAGLNTIGFVTYLYFSRIYVYNRKNST